MTVEQIETEILNGTFNWEEHSWAVAEHCPGMLDPGRYNWCNFSDHIAMYCPQHFDPELYNWEKDSWAVALFCPQHFDPKRYNWQSKMSVRAIKKYAPQLLLKNVSIH